jgi:hypothetical protein
MRKLAFAVMTSAPKSSRWQREPCDCHTMRATAVVNHLQEVNGLRRPLE